MSEEDVSSWVTRYRATVSEEPTPSLDEAILRAASHRAVRVRTLRRSGVALMLAAVITTPFWGLRALRAPQVPQATASSDYGRQEGVTRYYLMNVASYTGPGSMEQRQ